MRRIRLAIGIRRASRLCDPFRVVGEARRLIRGCAPRPSADGCDPVGVKDDQPQGLSESDEDTAER